MPKIGRFVIDTHVHAQRFAAGKKLREQTGDSAKKNSDYNDLASAMRFMEPYENSERLFYDMDCYGVDMCILQPAFGMNNEINVELVKKYPNKFRALAMARETANRHASGEEIWTAEAACRELDELLATGNFVGIGEGPATRPTAQNMPGTNHKCTLDMKERLEELRLTMDVARKHGVPVTIHTGGTGGYPLDHTRWPENWHPYYVGDIASEYPDVPIIFCHGGMQGGYMEDLVDQCIVVAASNTNVYLETGLYWTELYYKALSYPNVGPEKLIWGTDWGSSIPTQTRIGQKPQSFAMQIQSQGVIRYQCDVMGWSLKQLERLDISQDDLNLIVAGNALKLFKIDFPISRMFR